jgi:hypothetical protein
LCRLGVQKKIKADNGDIEFALPDSIEDADLNCLI